MSHPDAREKLTFLIRQISHEKGILDKYNDFTQFILFSPPNDVADEELLSPFCGCCWVT